MKTRHGETHSRRLSKRDESLILGLRNSSEEGERLA